MESKIKISLEGNKKVFAHLRGFTVETDQETADVGDNSAPTPFGDARFIRHSARNER